MNTPDEIKKKVGIYAADFIQPGTTIGLGTGSTVYYLVQELGERVKQGLDITIVPTSRQTQQLAEEAGINVTDLDNIASLPLTIDGADEVDSNGQLIKGGGGALLQEKIVASASEELIIIADNSKLVAQLGQFPLPVEVIPFGHKQVIRRIMDSGMCKQVSLRLKDDQPYITDHHHYILDCEYEKIENPASLNKILRNITGVVETGLFINMANQVIIGHPDKSIELITFR
jgi:ribose 5-phosphate isomerase A